MLLIGITRPGIEKDPGKEAARIVTLLESGALDRFHIRKPGAKREEVAQLLDLIPAELHQRLSLHSLHTPEDTDPSAPLLQVGGLHLNSRLTPADARGHDVEVWSASFHSIEEIHRYLSASEQRVTGIPDLEYATLSPIYDSISKQNYRSGFSLETLAPQLREIPLRIVALGGVTPGRLPELREAGFGGAAFLGYLWDPKFSDTQLVASLKTARDGIAGLRTR